MIHVLPDTNSLLHFKRPDQVDWRALTDGEDVRLILTGVPIREIDKHANLHPVPRLRERARRLKTWIRELIGPQSEPSMISVDVREPTASIRDGLDGQVPDDRLIATALMLRDEGKSVAVYSDDTVIHAKLAAFGIPGLWPRDEDRLKDEPSPEEAENARLKKELASFTNRQPVLSLGWPGDVPVLELYVYPPDMRDIESPDEYRASLRPIGARSAESAFARLETAISFGTHNLGVTPEKIETYNRALEKHHDQYADYYEKRLKYQRMRGHVASLPFVAHNRGTAVATSFRARLQLPTSLVLIDQDKQIGRPPTPPEPPSKPGLMEELFAMGGRGGIGLPPHDLLRNSVLENLHRNWDDSPYVDREQGSVELRRAKLLQHHEFPFEPAFVLIKPDLVGHGGHIEVRITAEELPNPVISTLAFKVVRGQLPDQ